MQLVSTPTISKPLALLGLDTYFCDSVGCDKKATNMISVPGAPTSFFCAHHVEMFMRSFMALTVPVSFTCDGRPPGEGCVRIVIAVPGEGNWAKCETHQWLTEPAPFEAITPSVGF